MKNWILVSCIILWTLYRLFSVNGNAEAWNLPQIFTGSMRHGAKVQQMTLYLTHKGHLTDGKNVHRIARGEHLRGVPYFGHLIFEYQPEIFLYPFFFTEASFTYSKIHPLCTVPWVMKNAHRHVTTTKFKYPLPQFFPCPLWITPSPFQLLQTNDLFSIPKGLPFPDYHYKWTHNFITF